MLLTFLGGGLLLGPDVRHRHSGGNTPHAHHHGHSHSHHHSHSHSHGHRHSAAHQHEGTSAEVGWHTHVSFLGWQLTLFDGDDPAMLSRGPGIAEAARQAGRQLPFVAQAFFGVQLLPGPERVHGLKLQLSGKRLESKWLASGRSADRPLLPPPKSLQI